MLLHCDINTATLLGTPCWLQVITPAGNIPTDLDPYCHDSTTQLLQMLQDAGQGSNSETLLKVRNLRGNKL